MANWATKRRWVDEAFTALERAGYHVGSAYTAVKNPEKTTFVYRDRLWQGADLAGLGVASFGHVNGVHMQNLDTWEAYSQAIDRGDIPLGRAYTPTREERMIREFVLQLKRGSFSPATSATSTRSTCSTASASRWHHSKPAAISHAPTPRPLRSRGTDCFASTCCFRASFSRSTPGIQYLTIVLTARVPALAPA